MAKRKKKNPNNFNAKLKDGYYNVKKPSAFGGARQLKQKYAQTKKGKQQVVKWLQGQDAYTLHKTAISKFTRRPTIVAGVSEQMQADLLDVSAYAENNNNTKFLLTAIDVFSRKAWVAPLTSKKGNVVVHPLRTILMKSKCKNLQTDKGKEFWNKNVTSMLSDVGVHMFHTENETTKGTLVERFNQTLKKKIYRLITYNHGAGEYLSSLGDLVSGYNNTVHTSIGKRPNEITFDNQYEIWNNINISHQQIASKQKTNAPMLSPGAHVRISKARAAFDRGYTPNWTLEIFQVIEAVPFTQPITYSIKDLAGEVVDGQFYRQELQKVDAPTEFRIEQVLDRKTSKGKKMILVKWLGYPKSFNDWIPEVNVV